MPVRKLFMAVLAGLFFLDAPVLPEALEHCDPNGPFWTCECDNSCLGCDDFGTLLCGESETVNPDLDFHIMDSQAFCSGETVPDRRLIGYHLNISEEKKITVSVKTEDPGRIDVYLMNRCAWWACTEGAEGGLDGTPLTAVLEPGFPYMIYLEPDPTVSVLDVEITCQSATVPVLPTTWGRLKDRY